MRRLVFCLVFVSLNLINQLVLFLLNEMIKCIYIRRDKENDDNCLQMQNETKKLQITSCHEGQNAASHGQLFVHIYF